MGFIKKEILTGFLVSLFATTCGFFIYMQYASRLRFYETIEILRESGVMSSVIASATLPNLFVFFIFLKKKQEYRARGVLLATIITAILTFILKFL